ncbi:hypothetical protein MAHJHV58_03990 [Mycobacterium avium subsp. hominissuis]|uniref:hypothetical protein n=1 Tax=Mycobacterium avium TaxID=1764 RepID=UPI000452F80C|nr:hypothetical protein [Mycobacterium avium]ETZ43426.1 hypothetical protein L839_3848 [Mycobacterium avium MAV_120809_2495]MDO2395923.1 hypothetical protein [Mycobacterium avium subsp. hominissuis]UBV06868.1 hypothetical protein H8Z54_08660 [Mycobacterium avium subsp. hominissuis]
MTGNQRISPASGSNDTWAGTRETLARRANAAAVRALSPVITTTGKPCLRRAAIRGRGIFGDGVFDRKVTQVCDEYGFQVGLGRPANADAR